MKYQEGRAANNNGYNIQNRQATFLKIVINRHAITISDGMQQVQILHHQTAVPHHVHLKWSKTLVDNLDFMNDLI